MNVRTVLALAAFVQAAALAAPAQTVYRGKAVSYAVNYQNGIPIINMAATKIKRPLMEWDEVNQDEIDSSCQDRLGVAAYLPPHKITGNARLQYSRCVMDVIRADYDPHHEAVPYEKVLKY